MAKPKKIKKWLRVVIILIVIILILAGILRRNDYE